ncbi:MAG: metallopeptidase family protein [Gaiellales bacterium]
MSESGPGNDPADDVGEAGFEATVEQALRELPPDIARAISNVEIVTEEEHPDDPGLFGLYWGIPLTERTSGYAGVLPDKISLYRGPLVAEFGDEPERLAEEIRITVLHELAHHFGIDEDRLEELGYQ